MTWGAVGAAVVGAGVSYESSKKASEAAQAGQAQAANLTQQQLAQQQQQYQQLLGLSQPYRTAGEQALGQYQNLLQNPNAIYSDPTYQAMLNQGIQAVQANTAAQGTQMSGRTLAGLQQLGMSTASQYRTQIMNELAGLISGGQSGTTQAANLGVGNIQNIGSAYGNLANLAQQTGQLQAGTALGQGSALTGLIGNLAGSYMKYNAPSQTPAGTGTVPSAVTTSGGTTVPDLYSSLTGGTPYNISQSYTGPQQ